MIILRLLLSMIVLAGVLVLAYYTTKFLARTTGSRLASANVRVLEKVMLGKESYLLIVKIQDRVILLGVTPGGIQKLEELDDYIESNKNTPQDFGKIFAEYIGKGIGRSKNDKERSGIGEK